LEYKISGNVKDEKGNPITGVFVEAFDSDFWTSEDRLGNTITDSHGNFTMTFAPLHDPYANTFQRQISSLISIVDTLTISQVDLRRGINQMIGGLLKWSYYTTPEIMKRYGNPGPQVPKYPKRHKHNHSLPWNPKDNV
jgi:hypothetical protein